MSRNLAGTFGDQRGRHIWRIIAVVGLAITLPLILYGQEKICFPPHEGLPFDYLAPKVDGFVESELGLPVTPTTRIIETGWTRSSRITYISDGGVPAMMFQGIKHNAGDTLFMSFTVNFDQSYDARDAIVIALRPSPYSPAPTDHTSDARRIDIRPVYQGLGAGAATTSDPQDDATNNVRTNRDPFSTTFYRWDTSQNKWAQITTGLTLSSFVVKVRSWDNGVGDKNWSVEVKVPTTMAAGGSSWISLNSEFGFYFNVIRVCTTAPCLNSADPNNAGQPFQDDLTSQFTWPRATYTSPYTGLFHDGLSPYATLDEVKIDPAWWGTGVLGTSTDCRGVHFAGGTNGIGVQDPSNPSGPLTYLVRRFSPNTFEARLANDGTTSADLVTGTFLIANWGMGGSTPTTWDTVPAKPPSATNVNPTLGVTVPAGGNASRTLQWTLDAADQAKYPAGGDFCLWVILNSIKNVNFSESSVRRNLIFTNMSKFVHDAEISARGYPDPPARSPDQDFLLLVGKRLLQSDRTYEGWRTPGPQVGAQPGVVTHVVPDTGRRLQAINALAREIYGRWKPGVAAQNSWYWIVTGSRRSELTLSYDKKRARVYEPTGAFAYVGEHVGPVTSWTHSVSGNGTKALADNAIALKIGKGKSAIVQTQLAAVEGGGGGGGGPHCPRTSKYQSLGLAVGMLLLGWVTYRKPKRRD